MKLTIRKRNLPEWLIYYILIMPFMFWLLMDVLQLPSLLSLTRAHRPSLLPSTGPTTLQFERDNQD